MPTSLSRLSRVTPRGDLSRRLVVVGALGLLTLAAAGSAGAQGRTALTGFALSDDYILLIDGVVDAGAEIYFQRQLPGYLVMPSGQNTPLLVAPRSGGVQTVNVMKISQGAGASLDLAADALLGVKGQLAIEADGVRFQVDGTSYQLKEKPPLTGLVPASGLEEYAAYYKSRAEAYRPDPEIVSKLEAEDRETHVRVYLGTWCPFCQQYVPRMVRLANDLRGSNVKIDFYGLPKNVSSDPVAKQMRINAVPTGVIFVGGREVGRIQSDEWTQPEKAVLEALD